jgi:LuxR family maltose regulon positive regulatory protein
VELQRGDPTIWQHLACAGLATALYWTGDRDEARPYVEVAARSPLPLLAIAAYGYLGILAADDGDAAAADHHTAQGERPAAEHKLVTSPPYGRVLLARGRVHGLRGAPAASISSLEAAVAVLRPGPYPVELADALLWLAQARHLAGSPESARAARAEARLVLEDMPELGILAQRWEATDRLLSGEQPGGATPPPPSIEELSARELDVLQMLPTALSEAEIGKELFISYHTVHSHVRTIYRKLGTSSRAQTVERARATGLLPAPLGRSSDGAGSG